MVIVKLLELGSQTKEYSLENGSCVGDLLDLAEKSFVQGTVTRNNCNVEEDTCLRDGDRIFIGRATKGNLPFEVNFIRLGSSSVGVAAEDGYTIKQTLEQLDNGEKEKFFRPDGSMAYEFRISGRKVEDDHVLERPTSGELRIVCSQRVKGN